MKFEKIIPDKTILVDGIISQKIEEGKLIVEEIHLHEDILRLFETEAKKGKASGMLGLEEIRKLQEYSQQEKFDLYFANKQLARDRRFLEEELDLMIINLAWQQGGTLLTADEILAKIAQGKGIKVEYIKKTEKIKKIKLEEYFDDKTMSVHLREGTLPMAKKGKPGEWDFIAIKKTKMKTEEIKEISTEIIEEAHLRSDGFVEIERDGSTIVQLGHFRIVMLRPPLSDGWEITAVRPVKRLNIDDYKLSEKLLQRIEENAEGILISGSPGQGKSTFAQALAVFYSEKGNIVKTVEAPRDLILPEEITQLSITIGSAEEIHDILLLSRPDYTLFDEMRNTKDFLLYSDLRLSGVGMVGIVHGTSPIDSIQRFIGRIELGVIPHVLDTVIFIKDGMVSTVLAVEMKVKVPNGMTEADLARPVVVISDFESGKPYAEIYSYGEETVVIPVAKEEKRGLHSLAEKQIERAFNKYTDRIEVEVLSDDKVLIKVPEKCISSIIGREGKNISKIEQDLGIGINVRALEDDKEKPEGKNTKYDIKESSKTISFYIGEKYFGRDIDIYIADEFVAMFAVGKKGIIKIKKTGALGRMILTSLNQGDKVELRVK